MDISTYFKCLETMNRVLALFENSKSMPLKELNQEVISVNLPDRMRAEYIKQGGKGLTTKNAILSLLTNLEEAEEVCQEIKAKNEKRKKNKHQDKDEDKSKRNKKDGKCNLPGHNHQFSDCPNNLKGKNFNGTYPHQVLKKLKEDKKNKELFLNKKEGLTKDKKDASFSDLVGKEVDSDEEFYLTEKQQDTNVHPETLISIPSHPGSKRFITVKALLDIGASELLICPIFMKEKLSDYEVNQENQSM